MSIFSFKVAFQQLFSAHAQACDHAPWLVCGANLQGQLATVGSFYPVGSQGAISGWQAWWQLSLSIESYHQPLLYFLTRAFFPLPPSLSLPHTFPEQYRTSHFLYVADCCLSCVNWNHLSHSLVDMKPGLKSWLDSNLFIPSFGSLFWARIFLQGSSKEHHVLFSWTHTDNNVAINNLFLSQYRRVELWLVPARKHSLFVCLFVWGLFVSWDRILLCSSHHHWIQNLPDSLQCARIRGAPSTFWLTANTLLTKCVIFLISSNPFIQRPLMDYKCLLPTDLFES